MANFKMTLEPKAKSLELADNPVWKVYHRRQRGLLQPLQPFLYQIF